MLKIATNQLWAQLPSIPLLRRGWHLTRIDIASDFVSDLAVVDSFAASLDNHLEQIAHEIREGSYHPHSLTRIDVPKSALSVRPGSVLSIEDRIVLFSAITLIARHFDNRLPSSVYSFRLKKSLRDRGSLFEETDIYDLPYIKRKTIRSQIDPFDPWYAKWPEFDEASKEAFRKSGHLFMAVSDISAYFENISLPVLREFLLTTLPTEPKLINFIMSFFDAWASPDISGRRHARGIPQGSNVSSFFGNVFLTPLDERLNEFCALNGAIYFRYMDDIRIFTKDKTTARKALFTLDETVRTLQLNTQSSKTVIHDENSGEISRALTDDRIDRLKVHFDNIKKDKKKKLLTALRRLKYTTSLFEIARKDPNNTSETKILGAGKPLSKLTMRAFRIWANCFLSLGDASFVKPLLKETLQNQDYRLVRFTVNSARIHPKRQNIGLQLSEFIRSPENIFPHQEAEMLWALRYVSRIDRNMIRRCEKAVLNNHEHFYIRMQSAYLLSRTVLTMPQLDKFRKAFTAESNPRVKIAIAGLLMQNSGQECQNVVRELYLHPDKNIRQYGVMLRRLRHFDCHADAKLKLIFSRRDNCSLIPDHMPVLFAMAEADSVSIRTNLSRRVKILRKTCPIIELRPALEDIYQRCMRR